MRNNREYHGKQKERSTKRKERRKIQQQQNIKEKVAICQSLQSKLKTKYYCLQYMNHNY